MLAKPYHIFAPPIFRLPENLLPKRVVQFRPNATTTQPMSSPINNRVPTQFVDEVVAFWDYQFLFMSQRLEVPYPIKLNLIEGALPNDFPSGTYYLIGPGLFIDDYGSLVHPLDGHGYLRAFEIDGPNRKVRLSTRYVRTEAQMEECDPITGSWKFTHRGPFSLLKRDKMNSNTKVMKNVANTSILKWGGRLFCLWEGGTPYEIDPHTLDTIGSLKFIKDNDEMDDKVNKATNNQSHAWDLVARILKPILHGVFKMPPKRLLSHYKVDAQRGRLIVMACNTEDMVLPRSHYTFYEFDPSFNLLQKKEFNISDHSMIHDWAFTDTHYILFTNHIKLDILGSMAAIFGQAPMISALSVNHSKPTSSIYLLPRFSNNTTNPNFDEYWKKPIEAPQLWLLHVANAYESIDDDGNLAIRMHATACAYQWFNFQNMF
ncbi:Carotenoid cleavage dioxygenase 7 chloroplastic, partial [Bienertia sinuspersici]